MVVSYSVKGDSFVTDKPRVWSGQSLALALSGAVGAQYDVFPDGKRIAAATYAVSKGISCENTSQQAGIRLLCQASFEFRRGCRQSGVRRDKPACCRGCKSPTGKENSDSILASSLAGGSVSCPLKRRPEVPVGRAIELRKADGSGCRLLSEMEEGNTGATSARVAVGPA